MSEFEWETLGLFSIPLIKLKLDNIESVNDFFFSEIAPQADLESNSQHNTQDTKLRHFGANRSVFSDHPELEWLKHNIEKSADFVYRNLLNYKQSGKMQMTSAWFNLAEVGAAQSRHAHANSLISGTLYVNADADTSIIFYHPHSAGSAYPELYDKAVQQTNEYGLRYHFEKVEIGVKPGECLFWPSQLLHGYEKNKTPQRLSLSFNLMPAHMNSVYQITPAE